MHNEFTVIKHFWPFTLWHEDPESDGTDDSCGWFRPKLTKEIKNKLKPDMEYQKACFLKIYKVWHDNKRLEIVYSIYRIIYWQLYKRKIKPKDFNWIMELCLNVHDHLVIENTYRETENSYAFERLYWCIVAHVMGRQRKWWQYPRWHVRHWRFQFHFLGIRTRILTWNTIRKGQIFVKKNRSEGLACKLNPQAKTE